MYNLEGCLGKFSYLEGQQLMVKLHLLIIFYVLLFMLFYLVYTREAFQSVGLFYCLFIVQFL